MTGARGCFKIVIMGATPDTPQPIKSARELIGNLCYTHNMEPERHIWRVWQEILHRWGCANWAAWLLEAAGPITILGAQAVYLGEPILNLFLPGEHLRAIARLLEEPKQAQAFARYLREEFSA